MNTLTDTPVLSDYAEAYRSLIMRSSLGQVEQASVWYLEAQEVAEDVAEIMGTSLEVGASIVSAFSPRERWSSNVAKAYAFANGKPVSGLTNNLNMAQRATKLGFDALKGQKTNAFARAIAGDTDAVVIDTHMISAAGMHGPNGINKSQYKELCDAIRQVAKEFGITPRTCQALVWIVQRGSAN